MYQGWWKYGLVQTAAPAEEPVTLGEARAYLRVDVGSTEDDAAISRLITAARDDFERLQNRTLVTATWLLSIDCFPARSWWRRYGYRSEPLSPPFPWFERHVLRLPRPPLQSVTSIQYVDENGTTQTLSAANYTVDTRQEPGRVAPAYGTYWPATREQPNAVSVTYVAGAGAASAVPARVKERLLAHVAHCYEYRGADRDQEFLDRLFACEWTGTYS